METTLAPHVFVRGLTAGLAGFWTLRGIARTLRAVVILDHLAAGYGLSRGLVVRVALRVALRATVLDPTNLALAALILGVVVYGERL